MKTRIALIIALAVFLPVQVLAMGFEAAVGLGRQSPDGTLGYNTVLSSDEIDLNDEADIDEEQRVHGRLILDMPLLIPNIYLMGTPMEFTGTGRKPVSFTFGDARFEADATFKSKVRLDQYDLALFYGIPLLETATLDTFSVDLGLNVKYVDFRAEITGQERTTGASVRESESERFAIPMVFVAAHVRPVDWLSLEAEGRGVAYRKNSLLDVIGRVKIKPSLSPVFVAGGWRHEYLKIDQYDIKADIRVGGPFVEAGVQF